MTEHSDVLFTARGIRITPDRVVVGDDQFGRAEVRSLHVGATEPPTVLLAAIAIMAPCMAGLTLALMIVDMTVTRQAWSGAIGCLLIGGVAAVTWALWRPQYTVTFVLERDSRSWRTRRKRIAQDLVDALSVEAPRAPQMAASA